MERVLLRVKDVQPSDNKTPVGISQVDLGSLLMTRVMLVYFLLRLIATFILPGCFFDDLINLVEIPVSLYN